MSIPMLIAPPPFQEFSDWRYVVGVAVAATLFVLMDLWLFQALKRNFPRIVIPCLQAIIILSFVFGIDILFYISLAVFIVALYVFISANFGEFRSLIANNLKRKNKAKRLFSFRKKRVSGEALFNREEVYGKVLTAITAMSKKRIGALITFEKKNRLDEMMQSGSMINAPVSAELLQTIFYPGTRLHDGAVIIRNDQIVAASVYFTPTTRPLTGKYGSRHRAAIGISEITDAVTVVVSEETGRVSIAYRGELQTVNLDNFMSTFMDLMFQTEPAE